MNLRIFMLAIGLLWGYCQYAQVPVSNDGRYVCVTDDKSGNSTGTTLVIQSTSDGWKKEIRGGGGAVFTADSRQIFYKRGDTLYGLLLGTDRLEQVPGVGRYAVARAGKEEWLCYWLNGPDKALVLRNPGDKQERRFDHVTDYSMGAGGQMVLLTSAPGKAKDRMNGLQWIGSPGEAPATIWADSGRRVSSYCLDKAGNQLAFLVEAGAGGKTARSLWYFRSGMDKAELLADDGSPEIDSGLVIGATAPAFGQDGNRVFFYLRQKESPATAPGAVEVWSYLDPVLEPQASRAAASRGYAAFVHVRDRHMVRLEGKKEAITGSTENFLYPRTSGEGEINGEYALITRFQGNIIKAHGNGIISEGYSMADYNWSKATEGSVYLVSLKDGGRRLVRGAIRAKGFNFPYFKLSPDGRYVVYYDQQSGHYRSYAINSGLTTDITRLISVPLDQENDQDSPGNFYGPSCWPNSVIGWIQEKDRVLIYDHYWDIWSVDLTGKLPPVNLTGGYARRHRVHLRPVDRGKRLYRTGSRILLYAGRDEDYTNPGLVALVLDGTGRREELITPGGKYRYDPPVKAADTGLYLVGRQNADTPREFCYTRDFKAFVPVTSDQPEQRVGIKKELIRWKTFDGSYSQGVLYKPESFDPHKKYPIVFIYYETQKGRFDEFEPYPSRLNWYGDCVDFASDGYLVFTPDIHYRLGATGASVYNAVVSAAKYLSQRPYVDSTKMGICGNSFGGLETNLLVVRTHLFAAAWTSAGASDLISYNGIQDNDEQGNIQNSTDETGQYRIGVTFWQRPDLYIENSPVLQADKVTTPLLLSHNRDDHRVPFAQSVEFFKALRRLGKPVWLLSGLGGHGGPGGIYARQFFAHYLKGAPAPRWMLDDAEARGSGGNELELDRTGRTPGRGLTMPDEIRTPQQERLIRHGTPVGRVSQMGVNNNK